MPSEVCEMSECRQVARTLVDGLCPRCSALAGRMRLRIQAGKLSLPNDSAFVHNEKGVMMKLDPQPKTGVPCGGCGEMIEADSRVTSMTGKDRKGYVLHKVCDEILRSL